MLLPSSLPLLTHDQDFKPLAAQGLTLLYVESCDGCLDPFEAAGHVPDVASGFIAR